MIVIFANGNMDDGVEWTRPFLENATAVIAADGGSRHLFTLDWLPDLIIGDMDSLSDEIDHWLRENNVPTVTHPVAKDETDLELALLHAAAEYEDEILIFGATGGRLDQTLANIFLLAHPALNRRAARLVDRWQRAWLITADSNTTQTAVNGQIGDTVSLIPLAAATRIAAVTGLQWKLHNEPLTFGAARGTSNVMTANTATIAVESGAVLCVHINKQWKR